MNSEVKSIKSKLKSIINKKEVFDVVLFGSVVKGKFNPKDIDIAVISEKDFDLKGFHVSNLRLNDFFKKENSLITTLFREGYSLKHNKSFSELYGFKNRVLFKYELKNLNASKKVKVVNLLKKEMVKESEWLANQVFLVDVSRDYIFEKFFLNFNVKFKKYYILIH